MYILKNDSGEIVAFSKIKFSENYEYSDDDYDYGYDGKIYSLKYLDSQEYISAKENHDKETFKDYIRARRKQECFPVVNRGLCWYNFLSGEQLAELKAWNRAWLDAPETGIIPDMLPWINSVSSDTK